ncbi:helix-turn-helix domain-containing protein [Bradyrhizobium sp. Cp5.3]|uniref:helix-turn-helix domain-containing protein n=1 Tax=Bradyrhizobium sp. Cp5.3 TaxID=443598 RepID=UPI000481B20F|nr:helix-turn-helix domain-containing protein [Bradyrhizobium sp. Cp5.3]
MSRLHGKIVKAVRVRDTDLGRVVGESLKRLRELAGLSQSEIATRLKVGQAAISKIEHRGDVQISSLQKYVEALGAELRIEATFTREALKKLRFEGAFDPDLQDDDQFVFPIFGDDLFRPKRDVVLSVRPVYSQKIMAGEKTVELRRRFPISAPSGTVAYIYSTSPVRAMVGSAEIENVYKMPIADIWKKFGSKARITRDDFESYFSGLEAGFALKFKNARAFARPIDLSELRRRFRFEPPQSFLYASPVLRTALEDEYSDVSH